MIKRSIRDAFKSIIRNFSLSFASIICTTITLILVAVAIVAAANIRNTTKNIESELSIVAYLKQDSTEETIANVTADIKSNENVEFIEVKTKDEWKLEMEKYSDSFDRALNYLDTNPLLDSFVVKVKECLVVWLCPLEGGKEAVVDVYDPVFPAAAEVGRENLHVPGQHHHLYVILPQDLLKVFLIFFLSLGCIHLEERYMERGGYMGQVGVVRDYDRNLAVQLAVGML